MRNTNKKGFTIVELVVVVAVIAILAAVLIPTFSGIIAKAQLSADQAAVRQMNEVLAQDEALNGKPANGVKALEVLAKAGYNGDGLVPVTADHAFWWNSNYNIVVLANVKDGGWELVYPTKHPGAGSDLESNSGCTDLAFASGDDAGVKAAQDIVKDINNGNTSIDATAANFAAIANASALFGETFDGVTITLTEDVTLDGVQFNAFAGTIDGNGKTITLSNLDLVHSGENANGYFYAKFYEDSVTKSKMAFGLVNYLGEGGCIKNVTINYTDSTPAAPNNAQTLFGGIVGLLDGGKIENCTVTGTIKQYNRIGGIVGVALNGEIKDCTVSAKLTACMSVSANRVVAGGIVGYVGEENLQPGSLTISGCEFSGSFGVQDKYYAAAGIIGFLRGNTTVVIDSCTTADNNLASTNVNKGFADVIVVSANKAPCDVTIKDTYVGATLVENATSTKGGAVYISNSPGTTVTVENTSN